MMNLPEALTMIDGNSVTTLDQWSQRRNELLRLFSTNLYGFCPVTKPSLAARITNEFTIGNKSLTTIKEVELVVGHREKNLTFNLLIASPSDKTAQPFPTFLGLNFYGNHTIHSDDRIRIPTGWSRNSPDLDIDKNKPTALSRGKRSYRWPIEEINRRGFALATIYAGEIDPDFDDGFLNGVHGLFEDGDFEVPPVKRWGTIAAWSWGLSRALDYLVTDSAIDSSRVITVGHSRMGKVALWTAANDQRFAAAISNDSGCCGASLHRHKSGESISDLNRVFPHWLNGMGKDFDGREDELPVDQHELLSLIAPRPLYISSAEEDEWADPEGEFLSLFHATPAYRLFDSNIAFPSEMPAVNVSIKGKLSYHKRDGKHDILPSDWNHFLDFAKRELPSKGA